jgi:hypothetical protein
VKDKKKLVNKTLVFEQNPAGGSGTISNYKVSVAAGLPASTSTQHPSSPLSFPQR